MIRYDSTRAGDGAIIGTVISHGLFIKQLFVKGSMYLVLNNFW